MTHCDDHSGTCVRMDHVEAAIKEIRDFRISDQAAEREKKTATRNLLWAQIIGLLGIAVSVFTAFYRGGHP
jgi:hypothetical protein